MDYKGNLSMNRLICLRPYSITEPPFDGYFYWYTTNEATGLQSRANVLPVTYRFHDDTTNPTGRTVISRLWDFGDGTTSTLESPTHEYTVQGEYHCFLTIYYDSGYYAVINQIGSANYYHGSTLIYTTTNLADHPYLYTSDNPVPAFTATPSSGAHPLTVALDGSASVCAYPVCHWSADGEAWSLTGVTASHTFATAGTRTVRLNLSTAILAWGISDQAAFNVSITHPVTVS